MNNQQQVAPKTSYQDFLKDIYNSMKKINQTTTELNEKLQLINNRLSNIETNQLYITDQLKILQNTTKTNPSNNDSYLLSLASKLDSVVDNELPDIYKLTISDIDTFVSNTDKADKADKTDKADKFSNMLDAVSRNSWVGLELSADDTHYNLSLSNNNSDHHKLSTSSNNITSSTNSTTSLSTKSNQKPNITISRCIF
jgi:hypothetical protein